MNTSSSTHPPPSDSHAHTNIPTHTSPCSSASTTECEGPDGVWGVKGREGKGLYFEFRAAEEQLGVVQGGEGVGEGKGPRTTPMTEKISIFVKECRDVSELQTLEEETVKALGHLERSNQEMKELDPEGVDADVQSALEENIISERTKRQRLSAIQARISSLYHHAHAPLPLPHASSRPLPSSMTVPAVGDSSNTITDSNEGATVAADTQRVGERDPVTPTDTEETAKGVHL
eukprot:GHVQ01016084.1.p1 GENE.GHVQ01016084.1~~GHVQ01016084.1.p1  ORF type:complete len:232 (-),score=53.34 GHVQ01016084.1:203-898(-)